MWVFYLFILVDALLVCFWCFFFSNLFQALKSSCIDDNISFIPPIILLLEL